MPKELDQTYRKLCQYITCLFHPQTITLKSGESSQIPLKINDQETSVSIFNPSQTELFFAINIPQQQIILGKTTLNTPQEYLKDILTMLKPIPEHIAQSKHSANQYELLENIVYTILELSVCFLFSMHAHDEPIALLHLGEKITKRIAKIKSKKKQGQRLFDSFVKQADQARAKLHLDQGNYEIALAYSQAGLNDIAFFNSESVENRQMHTLFYQSHIAQSYIKLGRIDEGENVLKNIFKNLSKHPISGPFLEMSVISCNEIGDHYQPSNPLKAIEYYLWAMTIAQTVETKIGKSLLHGAPSQPINPELETLQAECSKKQESGKQRVNACYQRYGGTEAIAEQIQAIFNHQNIIQKIEIPLRGIIKLYLTSEERLALFQERSFIKKLNEPPQILIFLNYTVPPKDVLFIIQNAVKQSICQDLEKDREAKKALRKKQHENEDYAHQSTPNARIENVLHQTPSSKTDIPPHLKKWCSETSPQPSTQFPHPIEQPPQPTITWKKLGLNETDLQHPPTDPVYPFGDFWYGFIHPSVFEAMQDSTKKAIQSVLTRGRISNYGQAIKPTQRETKGIYFFKIKTNDGTRIYGQKKGYDETERHPLIEFNTIRHKHK